MYFYIVLIQYSTIQYTEYHTVKYNKNIHFTAHRPPSWHTAYRPAGFTCGVAEEQGGIHRQGTRGHTRMGNARCCTLEAARLHALVTALWLPPPIKQRCPPRCGPPNRSICAATSDVPAKAATSKLACLHCCGCNGIFVAAADQTALSAAARSCETRRGALAAQRHNAAPQRPVGVGDSSGRRPFPPPTQSEAAGRVPVEPQKVEKLRKSAHWPRRDTPQLRQQQATPP